MAFQIKTTITIDASPSEVWNVLTDFERYPEWNPFIKSISGDVNEGNQIDVAIQNMQFKPTVLSFRKNSEFKWIGHLLIKGIFDGEHKFKLIDQANGSTILEHSESFSGILVPFFKKKLLNETKSGFEEMNLRLKTQVEAHKKEQRMAR